MKRTTPLLALVLALPLAIPMACSDDSIDAGSGGSGTASTGTVPAGATTGTNTGSTGTETGSTSGGGDATSTGTSGDGGAGVGGSGVGGTGSVTSTGSGPPTEIAECQGHVYECGDLVDNDGDGLLDSQDGDCLGPCDDTEDSYFGGISGQAGPDCKVDCYFDQDSGAGNDDCHWDHRCDPLSVDPNFYPEPWVGDKCAYEGPDYGVTSDGTCGEFLVDQSAACIDFCAPLVPNGCDCFGCCELPAGGGNFVWLGSEGVDEDNPTVCTEAEIGNPAVCHPCTPVQDECYNPCGECEICIGKPTVPDHCFGGEGGGSASSSTGGGGDPTSTGATGSSTGSGSGGGGSQCADGVQACGLPGQATCDAGFYCITGCCREVPN